MAESTKKPNSFSKGMKSDLDANLLPPDTYKEATNGRLVTREDNSFVLKNAKGNILSHTLTDTVKKITVVINEVLASTAIASLTNPSIAGWQIQITGNQGFDSSSVGYSTVLTSQYPTITPLALLNIALVDALSYSVITNKVNISGSITSENNLSTYNILYDNLTTEDITITIHPYISNTVNGETVLTLPLYQTVSSTVVSNTYNVVGFAEFSDYVAVIAKSNNADYKDAIYKLSPSADFSTITQEVILRADLDLVANTNIRIELSEENDYFHRIYWTDGVNPLRTINLKENPDYYIGITGEDLDVFITSQLLPPTVKNIVEGGNVSCGAHSYCYRLITTDGKTSRVSNITNPIHIAKSSSTSYHTTLGGSLLTNSSNAVLLEITDIDTSYNTIQLIDIVYSSSDGAITANIISESIISSSTFNYTHNGNETKVSLSIGELLRSHVSWDTCGDLAIKDNRLFASNLTNNSELLDLDFRVKSYKYNSINPDAASTYSDTFINEFLHSDNLYKTTRNGWINQPYASRIPGAETPGYATAEDGVRVTFETKRFDLTEVQYFNNSTTIDDSSLASKAATSIGQVPHYGYLDRNIDGGFSNYKNPLFTEKFTGYQRGEIYRFGILFYDKSGNPTFVNPIGDIRMPDNSMEYISNDTASGRITQNATDGQKTFKHCGNISTQITGVAINSSTTPLRLNKAGIQNIAKVGDIVSGTGIQPNSSIQTLGTDWVEMTMSATQTATVDITLDTPTDNVNGFIMFPKFQVKLSESTRSKISGYSIVRVDRKDTDKSILSAGVLNQTLIHGNASDNHSMKNKNGSFYGNIYTPLQSIESISHSTFTYDTPESTCGKLNYTNKATDKLSVVARLDAGKEIFNTDTVPFFDDAGGQANYKHLREHAVQAGDWGSLLAGRFDPKSTDHDSSYQFTQKTIYTQYDAGVKVVRDLALNKKEKTIDSGQNIGPAEEVSSSKQGYDDNNTGRINKSFVNKSKFRSQNEVINSTSNTVTNETFQPTSNARTLHGVNSIFLSLGGRGIGTGSTNSTNKALYGILHEDFEVGKTITADVRNPFILNYNSNLSNNILFGQKLYAYIKRDVSEGQYGGNEQANFEANQYISTGHINFNPQALNNDEVFGGDTYINMYSLKKFAREDNLQLGTLAYPTTGIIFPVESTVNLDLRDGTFFTSTNGTIYQAHDSFLVNETYSSRNTVKTFLQKPFNFKNVNNYSNLVAASNLKLAGSYTDGFATWDANEIYELDNEKGPIYNLFNLRNEIFAIQTRGVSKLSINPRVVADNADAAAVTIVTGTGQIIQRADYIETLYGSQHYNNVLVTNTSAYWFDSNMSTLCKLVFGQGIAVQDLGLTTQNSNIFNALKNKVINDKALDYTKGGITLYHNKIHDEIGVCISRANNIGITHIAYSELSDVLVSKKEDVVALAFNLKSDLFTIGRNSVSTSIASNKIYREDSNENHKSYYDVTNDDSLSVTFVCNENVFTSKKFDKLVMYTSGNENVKKFNNFTFTDSISNTSFNNTGTGERMSFGKHIIPITSTDGTSKATGQFLIIKADSNETGQVELFSALIHNRVTK